MQWDSGVSVGFFFGGGGFLLIRVNIAAEFKEVNNDLGGHGPGPKNNIVAQATDDIYFQFCTEKCSL